MKIFSSMMEDQYAAGTSTLAEAMRITREDGEVFAFTSHDESREIDGVLYSADPGLEVSEIVIASSTNVGNLQLTTLHDGTTFSLGDVMGGKWRNAEFLIFRYNWQAEGVMTLDEVDKILAGTVGEIEMRNNKIIAELRDLRQYLQHQVGDISSKTCRYRLGDRRCGFPLELVTHTGAVDSIFDSKRHFTHQILPGFPADYFGWGTITFMTGDAAGLSAKIDTNLGGFDIRLVMPLFVDLQVGDEFVAVAGCRGRFEEDCVTKFSAIVPNFFHNFGGEPHRRGVDNLTANPDPEV